MCGLFGFISPEVPSVLPVRQLSALACANVLRGRDGAGLAYGTTAVAVVKTTGLAAELPINKAAGRFVGGHARAATSTHMGKKNTHPFQAGPITLMHNGTVSGAARKAVQSLGKECPVDSEEIAYALAAASIDQTIEALESGGGQYALVWHDKRDGVVRFIRNKDRPLHFAKAGSGVLYSSEKADLEWALSKSYTTSGPIKALNPHVLVESPPDGEPTYRKIAVMTPPPVYTPPQGHYYPYQSRWGDACEICYEREPMTRLDGMQLCTTCAEEVSK